MSYSYSSIKVYEECPFKYKLTRIDRKQEPSGEAAERGKRIHAEFESAIKDLALITPEMAHWVDKLTELREAQALCEYQFGINDKWEPCSFTDPNVWFRGIFDIAVVNGDTAHISDWKTGKERDYGDQLKVYATIMLIFQPEIHSVSLSIDYIDLKKSMPYPTVFRHQLSDLKEALAARIFKIQNDSLYSPKPSYGCRWCHFRKDNGGPCKW